MKILHVVPSFYPAHVYGGPIESVYQLCRHLTQIACEIRVLTTDSNGLDHSLDVEKKKEIKITPNLSVRYCKRIARHSISPTLLRLLPSYIKWADVVHLTAVYSFPTIPTLIFCKLFHKPLIWSPRGALQRWEGSRRVQLKVFWEWMCRIVSPKRLCFHVTSEKEAYESLKRIPGVKTVVIPNGVELPSEIEHKNGTGVFRLLFLGRMDLKKGIENLLEAVEKLHAEASLRWSLTIAGTGDSDYRRQLCQRIHERGLAKHVFVVDGLKESKKTLFGNADVVIIPSFTENFGMVIAEALAYGVPVIASRGTPWRQLEEKGCGLWVDNDPVSLTHAIECIRTMPLNEMGQKGREWMKKEFSWRLRINEIYNVYKDLLNSKIL